MFRHPRFEGGGRVAEFALLAHARQRQRGGSRWSLAPQLLERPRGLRVLAGDPARLGQQRQRRCILRLFLEHGLRDLQRFGRIARAQLEL
jgi:hypothetical protein